MNYNQMQNLQQRGPESLLPTVIDLNSISMDDGEDEMIYQNGNGDSDRFDFRINLNSASRPDPNDSNNHLF